MISKGARMADDKGTVVKGGMTDGAGGADAGQNAVDGEQGVAAIEQTAAQAAEAPATAMERVSNPVSHPAFDQFVATVAALRAPDGCPWDKEQTHASIARNMIEEAYEAVDAIEGNDTAHLREELGDVMLQAVLHSQIAADAGEFTIDDVCADVNDKLIRRHPHVFGTAQAGSAAEVLDLWDKVKLSEKASKAAPGAADASAAANADASADKRPKGLLDSVPASFPALMQAQKIARKAASAGFEWGNVAETWDKVYEEIGELNAAYEAAPKAANGKMDASTSDAPDAQALVEAAQLEFGDVLFSLIRVANKMGIDAESALRATCRKFRGRWEFMEGAAAGQGTTIQELPFEELDALWDTAKLLS